MKTKNELTPFDGLIGTGQAKSDWTPEEYKQFEKIIIEHRKKTNQTDVVNFALTFVKLEMGDYLIQEEIEKQISVGDFLKKFIKATGKKNKVFAKYIGIEESNLSSIISGRRKINIPLALKLEQIFGVNPSWWFEVQLKNEFLDLKKQKKKTSRKKYSLKGLLKKVS